MYNYLGIVNKSSAVNRCISCSFLNPFPNLNLVIAKANIIEIYNITKEGLEITPYIKVYGNIIILEKINYFNSNQADDLFLMTDDLDFSIISFDKNKNEIVCLGNGNIREDIGKMQDKISYAFDNDYKFLVVSAYKNIFKIIFLQQRDKNADYSIKSDYEELLFMLPVYAESMLDDRERLVSIISNANSALKDNSNLNSNFINNNNFNSTKFTVIKNTNNDNKNEQTLNTNKFFKTTNTAGNPNKPAASSNRTHFAFLKVNNLNTMTDQKQLLFETFSVDHKNKQINKEQNTALDLTNNPAISFILSPRIGGLCIFYSNSMKYYEFAGSRLIEREAKNYSDRKFIASCEIDKSRYLLSDESGNLFILGFKKKDNNINININNNFNYRSSSNNLHYCYNLIFQFIGEINSPSSIAFLDNNYFFIGSEKANSQLIKTLTSPRKNSKRPLLEVIEEYDNLAPITDFLVLNKSNEEGNNTEILSVSGSQRSCCLKIIRKGTSFHADAEIYVPFVKRFNTAVYFKSDHDRKVNENDSNLLRNSVSSGLKDYCDDDFNHGNTNENVLFFLSTEERTTILNYNKITGSLDHFSPKSDSLNILSKNETLLSSNFNYFIDDIELSSMLQLTTKEINIFDIELKYMFTFPLESVPIKWVFRKRNKLNELFIYNNNNQLIRIDLNVLVKNYLDKNEKLNGDDNEMDIEKPIANADQCKILLENAMISALDVSMNYVIYSVWNENKIYILSINSLANKLFLEIEEDLFVNSLLVIKNEGMKFLFISFSNGKILFYKFNSYFARGMPNYKYSVEDFILKRKYFLTNECFELRKIKSENSNFIFINTELPCLIYINKETPVVTNFNIKECSEIKSINSLTSLYAFVFREKVIFGSLNNSQSQNIVTKNLNKQIYNLANLEKINAIACIQEEIKDELETLNDLNNNNVSFGERESPSSNCALVIMDKNLNELTKYTLERKNEVCYSFAQIDLKGEFYSNDKSVYFALGSAILEDSFKEPEMGFVTVLELNEKLKFRKLCEIETRGGVYKIGAVRNIIYVSIASCFYIYKLNFSAGKDNENNNYIFNYNDNLKNSMMNSDSEFINERANLDFWNLKLVKKSNEFNFIYDFICEDEQILVSDMYRSVALFRYNTDKDKFQELARDFNPIWCNSIVKVDDAVYLVSDINNNLYNLKFELSPKTDEERYMFQKLSQFNFGEKILKMVNVKKPYRLKDSSENQNKNNLENRMDIEESANPNNNFNFENYNFNNFQQSSNFSEAENFEKASGRSKISDRDSLNITYFSTSEGTIGVVINISKEIYDYLSFVQKEIIKVIISSCNFEYEKWRSVRDGYLRSEAEGFIEGSILQEFLNFDEKYRIDFMKNLKYPFQKSLNETINLIETLLKYH